MSQESPTVEFLTGCGLPEAQAKKSVDAIAAGRVEPKGKPCSMHYTLKLKEGHKMDDLLDDLDRYGKFAKATPGKLSFFYSVEGDEMLFFDNMEGPSVMDAHIGHCFPSYVKMMAHADMKSIRCCVDPGQVEWWKKSLSAWGGDQVVSAVRGGN